LCRQRRADIAARWFGAKSGASELHSINPFCEHQRGSQHFPKLLTKQRARCIKQQNFNSNASHEFSQWRSLPEDDRSPAPADQKSCPGRMSFRAIERKKIRRNGYTLPGTKDCSSA
jgi:hypothetical protein